MTVWYFAGCRSWREGAERVRHALDAIGRPDAQVRLVCIETLAEAVSVRFAGSPTFTLDGVDLFDSPLVTGVLTCRLYATADGVAGVPETRDLVAALTKKVSP